MTLYNFQKFESFKNQIKNEKKLNHQKQLWSFVEQYFDPNSTHERLKESANKHTILGTYNRNKARQRADNMPTIMEEDGGDDMISEMTRDGDDQLNDTMDGLDTVSAVSDFPDDDDDAADLSRASNMNMMYTSMNLGDQHMSFSQMRESYEEEKKGPATNSRLNSSQVILPTNEELKSNKELQIKMGYVDAISRVFYHLRGALDEPNFLTEKISQRVAMMREPNEMGEIDEMALNLEDLFKHVLEDDRN